jgi:hypothetical protein
MGVVHFGEHTPFYTMYFKIRFFKDGTIRELELRDALPYLRAGEAEVYIEEPERAVKKHRYAKAIKV